MQFKTLFVAAAAAAATCGTIAAANPLAPAAPNAVQDLFPRQTGGGGNNNDSNLLADLIAIGNAIGLGDCIPQALPLVTLLPPIPRGLVNKDVVAQAVSQTTLRVDQVCSFSITGTAGSVYSSWVPTGASFFDAYSSDIAAVVSKCPSASAFSSTIVNYTKCPFWSGKLVSVTSTHQLSASSAVATTATGGGAGSLAASTTPQVTASSGTGAASSARPTSVSSAEAARHTGAVIAGAALAGVMAVVVAL